MAKLGEVCLLKAGKFVSANDISPEYNKGLYPCFGGNGIRGYVADYTHDGEFPLIGRQGALCGNVNLASGKFHATEHAVVVQPKIEMNVHWLYYALNAMNLGQYATGAAQPGLAVSKLETLSIEIPNISEQNKIAQTLYKVEQLVNFRKQQLAKLDELVKARFVEMFGEPIGNPMGWPVNHLVEISQLITNGNTPKGGSENYVETGIAFLRSQNVWRNRIDLSDVVYIDEDTHRAMKKSSVCHNDILITKTGRINTENSSLGRAALFQGKDNSANINGHVYLVRLKEGVNPRFVVTILTGEAYRKYIRKVCVGGIDKRQINLEQVEEFPIIKPPLLMQNDFATFVERVDQQKQTVQQSLEKLELMKKALMQEYFG